ncbi:MAG: NACHT domain-containing NTPase [Coleofasciculaceae cyanobacterium]
MANRSLKASEDGIKRARRAFERKGWTQEYLAGEVGIETRQPIWKFFKGKPVDRHVFTEICFRLDLEPEDIMFQARYETAEESEKINKSSNINELVRKVRSQRHEKIQNQCGTLRLLDIARPVSLDDLYVEVNILEEITSQRWLAVSDLQDFSAEEFDRLGLGKIRQERIPGLKAVADHGKLMVLGKPGAGKTTFLQKIAIQCNQGYFQAECIPIFLRLKNFAEDALDENNFSLIDYINQEFCRCGLSAQETETLLDNGRLLILLDGLDEVSETASDEIIKQIRKFAEKYYKNQLIITCRLAAQEYRFQGFTEVEIADFKPEQIKNFVQKWFVAVARNSTELGLKKAFLFLEQMALPENQPIRELATTPVLLNLTCLVFQSKAHFPSQRAELYKQGLDILLIRWDEARGIKRDEVYRNLSLPDKLQLLSQLAAKTFEQGEYFFEESRLGQLIANYLRELRGEQVDDAAIELDSSAVIKSIEAQHGLLIERARQVYSFSHLTFQEYFTARATVANSETTLPQLVQHLTDKRWREVFLLTAQMLPNANLLLQLLKRQVDTLITEISGQNHNSNEVSETLSKLLSWLREKSQVVKTNYKPAAVRAFYLTLALPPNQKLSGDQSLALVLDRKLAGVLSEDLALDLALFQALNVASAITPELFSDRLSSLRLSLELDHLKGDRQIINLLKPLKNQLPQSDQDRDSLTQWWLANGQTWLLELRTAMIKQRNIGHEWHSDKASQQLLEKYYYANKLLGECLNSGCHLTAVLQREIEERLLLPLCRSSLDRR